MEAALLTSTEGDRFIATRRGRERLAEHPAGIDESVLMQFPEFRAFIQRSARRPPPEDPRSDQYDEGYAAHQAGSKDQQGSGLAQIRPARQIRSAGRAA